MTPGETRAVADVEPVPGGVASATARAAGQGHESVAPFLPSAGRVASLPARRAPTPRSAQGCVRCNGANHAPSAPARTSAPEWRGLALGDWLARFVRDADLTDVLIRASFRYRPHEGAVPIVEGAA